MFKNTVSIVCELGRGTLYTSVQSCYTGYRESVEGSNWLSHVVVMNKLLESTITV